MIELNNIYNIDCLKFMDRMITDNFKVDLILTSPPYNIGVHDFDYDEYNDNMSTEDYFNFINKGDIKVLKVEFTYNFKIKVSYVII